MSTSWDEATGELRVEETSPPHMIVWDLELSSDGEGGAEAMLDRMLDWPTS